MIQSLRPPHHIGFCVVDLAQAARHWAEVFGAGPFLSLGQVEFDAISSFDQPCIFKHSAAFGQWGDMIVELQQIDECAPAPLYERLVPGLRPILNHVSYVSDNAEADSAALTASGSLMFMYAKAGEIEARFHDAKAALGLAIEIHRPSPFLTDFTAQIKDASIGWNGRDSLQDLKDRM